MINITSAGTQRLDQQNGTSGRAPLDDSILAFVSSKGKSTRQAIQTRFDRFPGVSKDIDVLVSLRLLVEN